jgi:hypothetical protein
VQKVRGGEGACVARVIDTPSKYIANWRVVVQIRRSRLLANYFVQSEYDAVSSLSIYVLFTTSLLDVA